VFGAGIGHAVNGGAGAGGAYDIKVRPFLGFIAERARGWSRSC